ncbi:unnamed protein product [Boreogadus saida]
MEQHTASGQIFSEMSKMMGFQLGVILLYAFCLSTQVLSQSTPPMAETSNSTMNSTMATHSYTGSSTNATAVAANDAGSLHAAGLSSLLPSFIVAASFLQRFS